MSQPAYAVVPSRFDTPKPLGFTAANTTVAKILFEPQASAAATGNDPPFYGGSTVLDLTVSSTDGTAKDMDVWQGKILTTQSAGATGTLSITTQNVLNRTAGSWIADGHQVGDEVMIFAPYGTAQAATGIDGIVGIVTAVAALTMTVNGTPWANNAGLTAGTRVINVSRLFRTSIPANSGSVAGTKNVSLVNNSNDSAQTQLELKLGSDTVLIANMVAAVSALPARVAIATRSIARY